MSIFQRNKHMLYKYKCVSSNIITFDAFSWWRHQLETYSALLGICAGNSPVTGDFPAQRPVTRSFDVFFDRRLIKRLSKQSRGWWFQTPSRPLWPHCNDACYCCLLINYPAVRWCEANISDYNSLQRSRISRKHILQCRWGGFERRYSLWINNNFLGWCHFNVI